MAGPSRVRNDSHRRVEVEEEGAGKRKEKRLKQSFHSQKRCSLVPLPISFPRGGKKKKNQLFHYLGL